MSYQDPIPDYQILADRKQDYLNYESNQRLTWCEGCGNFGIQKALERALVLENLKTSDVLLCFDIGCHGNGSDKIAGLGGATFHGLHGRVISAAAGAALANPRIKVIAEAGDGGTFSEGPGHLIHAVRSNYPMVFILHNNENFALTTGQASALTRKGFPMNGSPDGVVMDPINACDFVLGLKPSFVARSFSDDVSHMTDVIRAGLRHNGFAFIEILQTCPTYNHATSTHWFHERIHYLESVPKTLEDARKAAADLEKEISVGVLYQDKNSVNFLERMPSRKGVKTTLVDEVKAYDIRGLTKMFE
jgi:2-oxoglutarate/2-oxoacid ferredoxin oxidoreductase subunit beta